jgi:glycosyltransferase involved in cell wall biosynthesis
MSETKKLSILICTLGRRKVYFDRLLDNLKFQIKNPKDVEVLCQNDNGQLSIGQKRNRLLEKATGDYIAFIDDDDLVAPNYIDLIIKAIEQKPDVVGMNLIMTTNGSHAERSFHSIKFDSWFDLPYKVHDVYGDRKVYFRNPNHLNPVKRELALETKFPDVSMCEDADYSKRLFPLLKSEVFIEQPLYFYLCLPHAH